MGVFLWKLPPALGTNDDPVRDRHYRASQIADPIVSRALWARTGGSPARDADPLRGPSGREPTEYIGRSKFLSSRFAAKG